MMTAAPIYLETSAIMRVALEPGTTPEIEAALAAASSLVTSRLTLVESGRALLRAALTSRITAVERAEKEHMLSGVWNRCVIWEISTSICDAATMIAPQVNLRSLDAIHLATFLAARRHLGPTLALLTADSALERAAAT